MTIPAFPPLSLAYLGPRSDHRENVAKLLTDAGLRLCCLDDSLAAGVYGAPGGGLLARLWGRMARARAQAFGTSDGKYLDWVLRRLDEEQVECLLAYWGIGPVGDIITVKRRRPRLKVVLNVLCHPLALSWSKIALQNSLVRRAVPYLDALVFPSQAMKEYFDQHILRSAGTPSVVLPPRLTREYFPDERPPRQPESPNLVFLGRMDWWAGQPTDNVGALLGQLMDLGVHVFHHATERPLPPHFYRHTFTYLPLQGATTFCSKFDASLVVYNTAACSRDDRFRVTVPDRLIASVAAGAVVALPAHGYDAAREYLRDYAAVIEFETPEQLRHALSERDVLDRLREAAWQDRHLYHAEDQVERWAGFLTAISRGRDTAPYIAV